MHYRLLILSLSLTLLSGQSLFNRWVGSDPFIGSARSTAIGNTHLLNSTGSTNVRFNPAKLGLIQAKRGFDFQINRLSVFERWSMPVKDYFGDFLTYADYVANEFSNYDINSGLFASLRLPVIGMMGAGFRYAPLTHFTYYYSEEIRGSYNTEDGEYASKDPIVGYQNLNINGTPMMSSFGGGIKLDSLLEINISIGAAIHVIQSINISERVEVDTLYTDVTNLAKLPDINVTSKIPSSNFMTLSTIVNLHPNIKIGLLWEEEAKITTTSYSWPIDSTSGLLQYWDDSTYEDSTFYAVQGMNYVKPEMWGLAVNYLGNTEHEISISFELNQMSYNNHKILKDYRSYKFGFEYLTQMGTPIRGGLTYQIPKLAAMKPISMFTFGTGKIIDRLLIDIAGTYCFQSFYYPDLFPVTKDSRTDYDLVRDSQLHLQLALTYHF